MGSPYDPTVKSHGQIVAERRMRLKDMGLCTLCGQRPSTEGPRGGRTFCDQCRAANAASHRKGYERRRREYGEDFCLTCRRRPATVGPNGGRSQCDVCRERQITRNRKKAALAGLCKRCRARPATPGPRGGLSVCDSCRDAKHRAQARMGKAKMNSKPIKLSVNIAPDTAAALKELFEREGRTVSDIIRDAVRDSAPTTPEPDQQ